MNNDRTVAYFSMEIGIESEIPTYSGGLGILAGDTIRSAADLRVPMVAISLLHRKGYFYQRLDKNGWQSEDPIDWVVDDFLEEIPTKTSVLIEGRVVHIGAWRYNVVGISGYVVPIFLLDTDVPENAEWDRTLTHYLYGGDHHYRLCQEVILGIGGVRMLRALGFNKIERYHMNEGHASLLTLEILDQVTNHIDAKSITHDHMEIVRNKCVFTTHTPVQTGFDQFPMDMVIKVLGQHSGLLKMINFFNTEGVLNTTYLALNFSHYINGVAKKHGEISRLMYANYEIDAITNGVHSATWTSKPFQELFNRYIPGWQQDNASLRYALNIPNDEMWKAHLQAKKQLFNFILNETNVGMDIDVLTFGFARRATTYKRATLIFTNVERLKYIASKVRPLQIVFAGKAHPMDKEGKEIIKQIIHFKEILKNSIKIVYLPNYNINLGKLITSGVDVWLNTPQPPLEASGTSGMKAALNGVPSLSILDGWWLEGCIEGVTGWAIGDSKRSLNEESNSLNDSLSLYDKIEKVIIPTYYQYRDRFIDIMRHTIALNGSFFNTHRMIEQYVLNAYFR